MLYATMAKKKPAKTDPPSANELELSLFGPGKGECIVLHLGQNDWMVVDSCLSQPNGRAVALEYLEGLGVDLSKQVKMVLVTHWHDDHIKGAAQVLRASKAAKFACSMALRSDAFIALLHAGDKLRLVEETSGVREFADILEELQDRAGGRIAGPDFWAQEGTQLFQSDKINLVALSPSAQTITNASRLLGSLIPAIGSPITRVPVVRPNETSIAILVQTETMHFLLGGDLENATDDRCGWNGVLRYRESSSLLASVYKIAHHGSANADCEGIWEKLLVYQPCVALTPYAGGVLPRPAKSDVRRIKTRTKEIFSTVKNLDFKTPRRRGVDQTINEVAKNRRAIKAIPGHVRVRAPLDGDIGSISVALFDGAGLL